MKTNRLAIATPLLVLLTSCGLDEVGVRSIEFPLAPTPMSTAPAGLDATTIALMGSGHGSVSIDVSEDMGMVSIEGLPMLPTGFTYRAIARHAHGVRHALPGSEITGGGGHSHGAITDPLGDTDAEEEEELTNVPVGEVRPANVVGAWELMFAESDLGGGKLGAVRGLMVQVLPDGGTGVMIMAGQVEADPDEASEGGGHAHGP